MGGDLGCNLHCNQELGSHHQVLFDIRSREFRHESADALSKALHGCTFKCKVCSRLLPYHGVRCPIAVSLEFTAFLALSSGEEFSVSTRGYAEKWGKLHC